MNDIRKIRRCYRSDHDIRNYEDRESQFLYKIEKYNSKNEIVELEVFDEKGKLREKSACLYNSDGALVEETRTYPHDGIQEKTTYGYDPGSRELRIVYHYTGGETDTIIKTFDSDNRIISTANGTTGENEYYEYRDTYLVSHRIIDGDNVETYRKQYEYDDRGLLKRHQVFADGDLQETAEYDYVHENKVSEVRTERIDDYTARTVKIEYDGRWNAIKETIIENDIVHSTHEYAYDGNNNCTDYTITFPAENITKTKAFEYDSSNELIREISTDPVYVSDNYFMRYEYEYM